MRRITGILHILVLVAVVTALSIHSAWAQVPPKPHRFYGNVLIGGTGAPAGTTISVKIDGTTVATTTTHAPQQMSGHTIRYGGTGHIFYVPPDDTATPQVEGGQNNDSIEFYVNGVKATTYWPWLEGDSTILDLSATPPPTPTPTPTPTPSGGGGGFIPGPIPTSTPTTAPAPPALPDNQVLSVNVEPAEAELGSSVAIIVEVGNLGAGAGTFEWPVMVNGQQISLVQGFLNPGETTTFHFNVTESEPGDYSVVVGDQSTSFTIVPRPTPGPTVTPGATPPVTATPTPHLPGTSTPTPGATPRPTAQPTPTTTPSVRPTATPSSSGGPTPTPRPTSVPGPTPTPWPTPTPTPTPLPPVTVDTGTTRFQFSHLVVRPSTVIAGDPVSVSATVTNVGNNTGTYEADLTVGGIAEGTASGELEPGDSRTLSFNVVRTEAGRYTVNLADLISSFSIEPSKIVLSRLSVSPRTVGPGEAVRITVQAANEGGTPGSYSIAALVDGVQAGVRKGVLNPNENVTLVFRASRDDPGTYSIMVGDTSSDFTVVAPVEVELPDETTVDADTTVATDSSGAALELSGNTVSNEVVDGRLKINIPVQLSQGNKLESFIDSKSGLSVQDDRIEIPVKDINGNTKMKLVAKTDGFMGTGSSATASVTHLSLVTEEQHLDLSKDDPSIGAVSYQIQADLKAIPEKAKLTITPKKTLPADALAGFELVARNDDKTIADVGAALEVQRENLENVTDIGAVTLTMKVGRAWVDAHGGVDSIRMSRLADDGTREWLETRYIGDDAEGRMVFEAVSPNGFSLFALVALAPRPAAFEVSQLSVSPSVVGPDDSVRVSVLVTNKGGNQGTYNIVLAVGGDPADSQSVTLDAGKSDTIAFFLDRSSEGEYTVQIEDLSGAFSVATVLSPDEVTFSDLHVTPAEAHPGDKVSISLLVTNTGTRSGKTDVTLTVNKLVAETQAIRLAAGESTTLTFLVDRNMSGTYTVQVGSLTDTFTITPLLSPTSFSLSGITATPSTVSPDETVTITVKVTNEGESRGIYNAELKLNGQVVDTQQVTLDGLSSKTLSFTVSGDSPGTYEVSVGNASATFEVQAAAVSGATGGSSTMVIIIVIAAVAGIGVAGGTGYVIYRRRRAT